MVFYFNLIFSRYFYLIFKLFKCMVQIFLILSENFVKLRFCHNFYLLRGNKRYIRPLVLFIFTINTFFKKLLHFKSFFLVNIRFEKFLCWLRSLFKFFFTDICFKKHNFHRKIFTNLKTQIIIMSLSYLFHKYNHHLLLLINQNHLIIILALIKSYQFSLLKGLKNF